MHDGIGIAELRFSPSSSSHLGKLFLLPSRRSLFLREAKLSLSRSGPGREELTLMRGRQQLLLLLFILSAAGSRIASADTNPQDGNLSFSAILVGTQKKNLWSMGVVAQKVGGVSWLFFVSGESKFVAFSLLKVV